MVDRNTNLQKGVEMSKPQLDMHGTPMPAKTPINLQRRLDEIRKANSGAQR